MTQREAFAGRAARAARGRARRAPPRAAADKRKTNFVLRRALAPRRPPPRQFPPLLLRFTAQDTHLLAVGRHKGH